MSLVNGKNILKLLEIGEINMLNILKTNPILKLLDMPDHQYLNYHNL